MNKSPLHERNGRRIARPGLIDELLAELAKRSDDDDLAFAATEAAEVPGELDEGEEDDEEDYEGALLLYWPHGQFAELAVIVGAGLVV